MFSYRDCNYLIEKQKQSTARVVFFKEYGISNSFTIEASLYGF